MLQRHRVPEQTPKSKAAIGVTAFAIGAITFIECYALAHGIDGVGMGTSIAAIAGLGGYTLRDVLPRIGG